MSNGMCCHPRLETIWDDADCHCLIEWCPDCGALRQQHLVQPDGEVWWRYVARPSPDPLAQVCGIVGYAAIDL